MDRNLRLDFRKGDLIAVILVIMIAAAVMIGFILSEEAGENNIAQIYLDGKLVREASLDVPAQFSVEAEYVNAIAVENGKIGIVESDCPGGDCMHSGWISAPGRSIVCLPNRVEIRISGSADVDFVVG